MRPNLRTHVANAARYHGDEIEAHLAQIRECAEAVGLHAVSVGLLAAEKFRSPAEDLAATADRLTMTVVDSVDPRVKAITPEPDYTELDQSVAAFRRVAMSAARD